jgi:hypothetical protein
LELLKGDLPFERGLLYRMAAAVPTREYKWNSTTNYTEQRIYNLLQVNFFCVPLVFHNSSQESARNSTVKDRNSLGANALSRTRCK